MKEKKRRNNGDKELKNGGIFQKLQEIYGKGNCIHIKDCIYIVHINNAYYLMPKSSNDVFNISEATKLKKVISIKEQDDGSINAIIREETKNLFVTMLKSDVIEELVQWI